MTAETAFNIACQTLEIPSLKDMPYQQAINHCAEQITLRTCLRKGVDPDKAEQMARLAKGTARQRVMSIFGTTK